MSSAEEINFVLFVECRVVKLAITDQKTTHSQY